MSDKKNLEFVVRGGRASFVQLLTPKSVNGGKPRFSMNILLDPKDPKQKAQIVEIKKAIETLSNDAFGKIIPRDRTCLRKDDEPKWDGYEGMWYIAAARPGDQGPPVIVGPDLRPVGLNADVAKAGDFVDVKIRIYAAKEYKNINATIEVVQHVKKGERFASTEASVEGMTAYDPEDDEDLNTDTDGDDDLD